MREFIVAMLVLETGMLGAFLALDLFLFYVFWEVMLIPMYFIIGIWGGERRLYASIKFVIYTMVGSLLMLVAILYLYVAVPRRHRRATASTTTTLLARWCCRRARSCSASRAFALAFAIKVPLFPLHTWLPDAHVEAPTAGSVILAGVLLKFGTYGFLRFAHAAVPAGASRLRRRCSRSLAVIGIIYGALVAFAQDDVKKLVAYSSVVAPRLRACSASCTLNVEAVDGAIYADAGARHLDGRPVPRRSACSTSAATRAGSPSSAASGSRCRCFAACFLIIVLALGRPARPVAASSASS